MSVLFPGQVAFGVVPDPTRPNDFHEGFGAAFAAVCLYRADRIVVLRPRTFTEYMGDSYRLAGDFLAYVIAEDDFETHIKVESVNLVTGGYVHGVTARDHVSDIKLSPTGSIAWVEEYPSTHTLRLADRHGVRTPRHGHGVDKFSLRLRGSLLQWRQGHHRYSTRLA